MTNNFMIAYQGSEGSYSEELLKKEFSNYLNQEDAEQNLNPTNFFKNTEDSFEDVSDELIRKEE